MASNPVGARIPRSVTLGRGAWMLGGAAGIVIVLYFVLFPPRMTVSGHAPAPRGAVSPKRAVELQADGTILIAADTPFASRIESTRIETRRITDPLLTVSGIVVARVIPGTRDLSERWHFNVPELGTAHANWLKSNSEIEFLREQLVKTKELVTAETTFLDSQLRRLESGGKTGVIPEKDILSARTELLKAQLQGAKNVFAAQSELRVAENERVSLERELSQRGIEPEVFDRGIEHMVLVSANVPEAKISQVHEEQACRVRFYAFPDKAFDAHVETLSTTVTHELRTLRVLFDLNDPDGLLIPGMFAEVELGTEVRDAVVIPAAALLHVGKSDYVLVETPRGTWLPREVQVGEYRHGTYEVLHGLDSGQTVISEGAILLKPKVVESLTRLPSEDL
jgi:hypothetical protein